MKKLQGYRFRLEPKQKHINPIAQALGANRFVWNKLLALNLFRLANNQPLLWYNEMAWFIQFWKQSEEYSFLTQAPSQSLQQTAKALDRAFRDAFDKNQPNKRMPIFKKKGRNEAGIKYPQGFLLDENNQVVKLPKLGYVKYRNSRNIEGKVKNITISQKSGKYTVSMQTELEINPPYHESSSAVGVDMGIAYFATLSTGEHLIGTNSFKQLSEKLAKSQRNLAKKVKFSANWQKQKAKITRLQTHIADTRKDFLHKTSTQLSKSHAMIVIEDLKISNMTRSSKGTIDNPGKKVAQKSGLNRSILDQGWGEFRRQLEYKQAWRGGIVLAVAPHHTSQTCPCCRYVSKENRKTQADFVCIECGFSENADIVGAINVLAKGHVLLAKN